MNEIAQSLAVLLAAFLWGGLLAVDFVVTPARFRTPNVDRTAINAIGGEIFRFWGYVQLPFLVLLVIVVLVGGAEVKVILPGVFWLLLTAVQVGLLEPTMRNLRKPTLSPEELAANEGTRRQLHQAYTAADIFKIVLGAALLVILVTVNQA